MNLGWQDITAVAIVVATVAYVTRRIWRTGKLGKAPPCASCSACGPSRRQLVSLKPPAEDRERSV